MLCPERTVSIRLTNKAFARRETPKISANPWFWVATGLGLGLSPLAPGTVGSLLGLALAFPVQQLSGPVFWLAYLSGLAVLIPTGLLASTWLCRFLGTKDPPAAVIDEIAAQFLVTCLVSPLPWAILASFLLSRLFDIIKLFPCRQAEKLPEGWGVMADDLIAGLYALAVYFLLSSQVPALRG